MSSLFDVARECLLQRDPSDKIIAVNAMSEAWTSGQLELSGATHPIDIVNPGRPDKPELLSAREMPRRRLGSPEGHAAMIHSIGHIEFNAINLACDAVYRFREMPPAYYSDWIKVAVEEGYHFSLISQRLQNLGYHYGDFPGHDGLWELAQKTSHDVMARMALIPRVMEARGLDVTPDIRRRFKEIGDQETVAILDIILRDEVGHVEAGTRWFRHVCEQRGQESEDTYFELLAEYFPSGIRCPLHVSARLDAGFTEQELERLESLCIRN
ncbi:MAG: ferritin-like domain-containing protein [bacterium]